MCDRERNTRAQHNKTQLIAEHNSEFFVARRLAVLLVVCVLFLFVAYCWRGLIAALAVSIQAKFGSLLEPGDPEELYELIDLLATGSYGKVYTVSRVPMALEPPPRRREAATQRLRCARALRAAQRGACRAERAAKCRVLRCATAAAGCRCLCGCWRRQLGRWAAAGRWRPLRASRPGAAAVAGDAMRVRSGSTVRRSVRAATAMSAFTAAAVPRTPLRAPKSLQDFLL